MENNVEFEKIIPIKVIDELIDKTLTHENFIVNEFLKANKVEMKKRIVEEFLQLYFIVDYKDIDKYDLFIMNENEFKLVKYKEEEINE